MNNVDKIFSGARCVAQSEAYAQLVAEHLTAASRWLDAGCGQRLLENDLDILEAWLVTRCHLVVGLDVLIRQHRNIDQLVRGSLYALPFASETFDLITCNMVVEHLQYPVRAFTELARCLRSGGAVIINTTNLLNYGIFSNAVASKILPTRLRLWLIHESDRRDDDDVFPVRYRANTRHQLTRLFERCGLRPHKLLMLPQVSPFLRNTARIERVLMKITPHSRLLVCAHKP